VSFYEVPRYEVPPHLAKQSQMSEPSRIPMTTRRLWQEEAARLYGPLPSVAEQRANRAEREARLKRPDMRSPLTLRNEKRRRR
jgi:hypothetical protein